MAKSNVQRFANERHKNIQVILDTIKENKGIKINELVSKLHVNPPYFPIDKSVLVYLKDLRIDKQIKINKDGTIHIQTKEVELCQ